jgi:hypothetical protein
MLIAADLHRLRSLLLALHEPRVLPMNNYVTAVRKSLALQWKCTTPVTMQPACQGEVQLILIADKSQKAADANVTAITKEKPSYA